MARTRAAFGYVEPAPGKARCDNCNAFHRSLSGCHLFYELTRRYPKVFKLDSKVKPNGYCNAHEYGPYSERPFLLSRIVDAAIKEGR